MSVAPPAGNGTMIRTVRSGNVAAAFCAHTARSAAKEAQSSAKESATASTIGL
jgi:hypothetical protein